jgi:hypothetical protein
MPVSSVKLGTSSQKATQFGGNRRFLQTQSSATQPKILLPQFEPGLLLILGKNPIDDFKLILIDVTPYFKPT